MPQQHADSNKASRNGVSAMSLNSTKGICLVKLFCINNKNVHDITLLYWGNGCGGVRRNNTLFGLLLFRASWGIILTVGMRPFHLLLMPQHLERYISVIATLQSSHQTFLQQWYQNPVLADPWPDPQPFSTRFPHLFNLSTLKEGTVASFFSSSSWDIQFRRNLIDFEIEKFLSLSLPFSISFTLHLHCWIVELGPSPLLVFFVSSFFLALNFSNHHPILSFPYMTIWFSLAP